MIFLLLLLSPPATVEYTPRLPCSCHPTTSTPYSVMASLNLSANGPSIKSSYQKIVDAPAPTGALDASPTYGQWAVYAVQAPLVSAFQHDGGKESVLKVQSTGGELAIFH